jgi:hypothetical protein
MSTVCELNNNKHFLNLFFSSFDHKLLFFLFIIVVSLCLNVENFQIIYCLLLSKRTFTLICLLGSGYIVIVGAARVH